MRHIPDSIQWHEGMLLTPQHFQQLSERYETLVQYMSTVAAPFSWGVVRSEYDQSALVSGQVRFRYVEAVMRDGLVVWGGADAGVDLELALDSYAEQMRNRPLTVHLVVPAQKSFATRGELARYASLDGEAVLDENTGDGPVHIPRLRPRVGLWAGDSPPARFESLPVLRVALRDNAFVDGGFIPPLLSVPVNSALGELCAKASRSVREKACMLADQLHGGNFQDAAVEVAEARARVRSLAASLPLVEAMLQSGGAHPYQLYMALTNLAGHVSGISAALVPPQFPPFRQEELRASFEPVLGYIEQALAQSIVEHWQPINLEFSEGAFRGGPNAALNTALSAPATLDSPMLALGLRPPSGTPDHAALRWGDGCLIASASLVPALLANRVLGAARRRVERFPDFIPPRGMLLFALSSDPAFLKPGEEVQLVEKFSREPRPVEAVLYVRRTG